MIARLGQAPARMAPAAFGASQPVMKLTPYVRKEPAEKLLVGVDVFVNWGGSNPEELANVLKSAEFGAPTLQLITNRGVKVWPAGLAETFCTDHWRCRFEAAPGKQINKAVIAGLLGRLALAGVDFVKTENLYTFDGARGYSLGQGQ